jgi:hypothetical protein
MQSVESKFENDNSNNKDNKSNLPLSSFLCCYVQCLHQGGKSWFRTTRMAENVSVVFFPSLPLNVNRGPLGLIFSPWPGNRQTLNLSEWIGMDRNGLECRTAFSPLVYTLVIFFFSTTFLSFFLSLIHPLFNGFFFSRSLLLSRDIWLILMRMYLALAVSSGFSFK